MPRRLHAVACRNLLPVLLAMLTAGCGGAAVETTTLAAGALRGTLERIPGVGASFRSLEHSAFPGRSLFQGRWGGLNFEHVMNGSEKDAALNWFTPRTDPHAILPASPSSAVVSHTAEGSSWGVESRMTFTFAGDEAVDMEFAVRLHEDRFPHGYVAFMWASYMQGAVDPLVHFYGRRGAGSGWQSFGDEPPGGTIAAVGAPDLTWEGEKPGVNLATHPTLRFELPFCYGLLDGDGDPATTGDRMAYLMMFDQTTPIRLAMWNRFHGQGGRVDTGRPAWDWQYVIREPECGRWYGYRARLEYFPFRDRDDVLRRYRAWKGGLSE